MTTAGVAVGVANAESAQQANEAIINGAFDATPAGLVIDASGLRHVAGAMDTAARFSKDPSFYYTEGSDGCWSGDQANELKKAMNLRKQLMQD